jgi:formate dehydrogenase subunit gamma
LIARSELEQKGTLSVKHGLHVVRAAAALVVLALALILAPTGAMAQQTGQAPKEINANPNARNPTADSVNEEALFKQNSKIRGVVTIPDSKAANLIQPQGREWRGFHEGALPWIAGIAVLGMLLGLGAFYLWKGTIGDDDQISGEKIKRFNWFERFTHWMTASCFIVLAISGLNYIFGKRILQPLIGPDAFTAWSQYAKYAHNYLAWPFMLGIVFMFAVWVRDNVPNRVDLAWLKAGGGFFNRRHVDAERFNAGQKGVFWIVILFGLAMSVSGIIMLFPFSATDINGMQLTQVVHAVIGVLFIAAMLGHIYIGTLGMKGAYDAMGSGEVDLAWAKAHHNLWVEQQQARNAGGPQMPARPAAAAE